MQQMPPSIWCKHCLNGPASLDKESLFRAIQRIAETVSDTRGFSFTGIGVIIVTGRFVLESAQLRVLENVITFFLQPETSDSCQVRHLQSLGLWTEEDCQPLR